jgi:predicted RNase H-like HicB family nuclease
VEEQVDTGGATYFVARNPELGECIGTGPTVMDALADLKEARALALEMILAHTGVLPLPEWKSEMMPIGAPLPALPFDWTPLEIYKSWESRLSPDASRFRTIDASQTLPQDIATPVLAGAA